MDDGRWGKSSAILTPSSIRHVNDLLIMEETMDDRGVGSIRDKPCPNCCRVAYSCPKVVWSFTIIVASSLRHQGHRPPFRDKACHETGPIHA